MALTRLLTKNATGDWPMMLNNCRELSLAIVHDGMMVVHDA